MKKFMCIILLALSSALTITSCTDETVEPNTEETDPPTGDTGSPGDI